MSKSDNNIKLLIAIAVLSFQALIPVDAQMRRDPPQMQKLDKAPADFPVPTYSGNVTATQFSQAKTAKCSTVTATIQTKDEPQFPFQWYHNQLDSNGWSIINDGSKKPSPMQQAGKLLMLQAAKDNVRVLVICSHIQPSMPTTVTVSVTQSESNK